jgi:hypothetical protein
VLVEAVSLLAELDAFYTVKKTSRAIVVDERHGVTSEVVAVIAEGAFYHLAAPVRRIGAMDGPVRFSPGLEDPTVPSAKVVFETAKALSSRLTEAIERRKIAWFQRRIAPEAIDEALLTGDEP